jgi:hypothetical protein
MSEANQLRSRRTPTRSAPRYRCKALPPRTSAEFPEAYYQPNLRLVLRLRWFIRERMNRLRSG